MKLVGKLANSLRPGITMRPSLETNKLIKLSGKQLVRYQLKLENFKKYSNNELYFWQEINDIKLDHRV